MAGEREKPERKKDWCEAGRRWGERFGKMGKDGKRKTLEKGKGGARKEHTKN